MNSPRGEWFNMIGVTRNFFFFFVSYLQTCEIFTTTKMFTHNLFIFRSDFLEDFRYRKVLAVDVRDVLVNPFWKTSMELCFLFIIVHLCVSMLCEHFWCFLLLLRIFHKCTILKRWWFMNLYMYNWWHMNLLFDTGRYYFFVPLVSPEINGLKSWCEFLL